MSKPPYQLNDNIFNLSGNINRQLGFFEGLKIPKPQVMLRRQNKIKTIHGSLAIEGNTLSIAQITAILDGKRVLGPAKEIIEVKNALLAYQKASQINIFSPDAMLAMHKILMKSLITPTGKWRVSDVGILAGSRVKHIAPRANRVPELMGELFDYLITNFKDNALLASCVFHYEFEFIHPFVDGNGRMGRLWQHAILIKYHPIFEYVPVESIIQSRQKQYYKALGVSDKKGESSAFIEFSLAAILDSLSALLQEIKAPAHTYASRLELAQDYFKNKWFSRKAYLQFFKTISTATASRDLINGLKNGTLKSKGQAALTQYLFTA